MKTTIQEAVVEPAELDPPVQPLTYDELVKDLDKSTEILLDDFSHFIALSLQDKRRIRKLFKRVTPKPEFKSEHEWLCDFMKEEIESDEKETIESGITEITSATTAEELRAVATKLVSDLVSHPGRGAKKDFTPDQVEEFAATLKTKTAVAQALGFYGAPGFNNRLATDSEIKAAYERGLKRREA